jgi:hypothetical protein
MVYMFGAILLLIVGLIGHSVYLLLYKPDCGCKAECDSCGSSEQTGCKHE